MADNFGGGENIFFFDDANIVVIDPNAIIDSNGQKKDRVIKQENLVMYANLEVETIPRTQLSVGQDLESGIQNVTLASINFLKPLDKKNFDTSYTDQFTGGKNFQGQINERTFDKNSNPQQTNYVDTQLLGIKSISVDVKFNGIPTVTMQLIDVQGRALFETGGNSPYSVFFYYPYPIFKLTLKGFYGKAIQYALMLTSFNASFETSTGNYIIDLKFIARTSAILDDIRLGYLFALPNMYPIYKQELIETSDTSQAATAALQQIGTGLSNRTTIVKTSKGRSKLEQVFQEYRDKGLIDKSVPTLTLEEMSINLTKYTQFLNQQFELLNFNNLLYLTKYEESLKNYTVEISNWVNEFTDNSDVIVLNDSTYLYGLKDTTPQSVSNTTNKLLEIVDRYKQQLNSIPVYGEQIPKPDTFFSNNSFQTKFTEFDINFKETYYLRTGLMVNNLVDNSFIQFQQELIGSLKQKGTLPSIAQYTSEITELNPYYYTVTLFNQNYQKQVEIIEQERLKENEKLNQQLQNSLKQNGNPTNLPFRPTIRNVVGVIMASVDSFYRLMYDVHTQAWNQRDNKDRINAIIKSNTPSQEGKNSVETSQSQNITNVVYPWPQFVQKTDIEGKSEYVVTYPGSKSVVGFTKGYDTTSWPEVEFVEQFLYGLTVKDLDYNSETQISPSIQLKYTLSSAIEFNLMDDVYTNKDVVNFVYEMYERILLNTFYSGFYYIDNADDKMIGYGSDLEINNIINSNISDGDLKNVLKTQLNGNSLYNYLQSTSGPNEEGDLWNLFINQGYIKTYIDNKIKNSNDLYSNATYNKLTKSPTNIKSTEEISTFIQDGRTSKPTIFDTYPFVIEEFNQSKMEKSNVNFYDTLNTYTLDTERILLTNQKNPLSPFTKNKSSNVGFVDTNKTDLSINTFYRNRYGNSTERMLTEGNIVYNNSTRISDVQTTSMLNTPYFLNSLLSAATITDDTKFVTPAYLFLNSLPLSTLYERYLNTNTNNKDEYIFTSLSKFSAVHKLPYAWILKIGSVWYRYKKYINDGVDILDSVWKDFDYKNAYDPQTKNVNRVYQIITNNSTTKNDFVLNGNDNLKLGFYPELYNSVFKLITGNNLFTNDVNDKDVSFWDDLKINTTIDTDSLSTPIKQNYSYLKIGTNYGELFQIEDIGKNLLFPSGGYIPFQQAGYQVTDKDYYGPVSKNKINVNPTYNGSAKVFWEAPNYGWFDTTQFVKPKYNEYIKTIQTSINNEPQFDFNFSQSYSTIEDLFGVFNKEQLDKFEKEFLDFCKENSLSDLFKDSDSSESTFGSFKEIFKRILIVDGISDSDSAFEISKKQTVNINQVINKFLDISVQFKIGNSREFDRFNFGNFISDNANSEVQKMKPKNFNGYGVFDSTSSAVTNTNSVVWKSLRLNVGFSSIEDIDSYCFDFFKDNNIAFTENNVELLSKIIKIYATKKKLNNGNYDSDKFKNDITDMFQKTYQYRTNIENQIRLKIPNNLNSSVTNENVTIKKVEGDNTKLEMWEVFKSINDKWVGGVNFSKKLLFDEFLFFDRANRDIGDTFLINVESIRKYCSWENSNTSVMSLIRQLVTENKMNFFVLPAYINFYGKPSRMTTNRNQTIVNNANDVFSTFGYVDYIDSAPKFLCQYVGTPSSTLSMDNDPKYPFKSDSFDLGTSAGNPIRNTSPVNDEYKNNKAVGFVVDFGVTNQNVFKSFEIAQNQNVTSSEQIQVIVDMGRLGANKKVSQQTTALYELYKSRTYDCTLQTLGNVMLQPTMYFVVRHMPMFNGTYVIRNVKHDIRPGVFNTTIQGQRISSLSNQKISDELASINEDFTKKLESRIKTLSSNNNLVTLNSNSNLYVTGQEAKDLTISGFIPYQGEIVNAIDSAEQSCQENLWGNPTSSPQSQLFRVDLQITTIQLEDLVRYLKENEPDKTMRLFLFCLFYLSGYRETPPQYSIKMNNLFGAVGDIKWNNINEFNGYRCLLTNQQTPRPFLSFSTIEGCIKSTSSFFSEILKSYISDSYNFPCINTTNLSLDLSIDIKRDCYAEIFVSLWYNKWYTSGNSQLKYFESNNYPSWILISKRAIKQAETLGLIS